MIRPVRTCLALVAALALVAVSASCTASSPTMPAARHDVGVELFQWTWDSVAAECTDDLGPAGIAWALVSPPQEHITGPEWWTSYQPVSYLVDSRLGTEAQFTAMVNTCDTAGVGIVADAVINHMTGQDVPGVGWAGSPYAHYDYPGIYTPNDFHHCDLTLDDDIADYSSALQVQTCELVNLADLDTKSESVQQEIADYLDHLMDLGVMGFRIDAAKHIPADDVAAILDRVTGDPYIVQEVIRGGGEPIQPEDYLDSGDVYEFGYAEDLSSTVESGLPANVADFGPDIGLLPSGSARVFVDNHDTERNGTTTNYRAGASYRLATLLMLAGDYGKPVLYSGYAFSSNDTGPLQDESGRVLDASCAGDAGPHTDYADGEWVCQHRWPGVAAMVGWHNRMGDAKAVSRWSEGDGYAFDRGQVGFAAVNSGDEPLTASVPTSLADGTYCDVVTGGIADSGDTCVGTKITVASGKIALDLAPWDAIAIEVDQRL